MSINTGDNFRYQGKKYLDDRQSFKTLSELMTYTNVPPGFIAYCEENGERYEYVNDTWILYKVSTDTGDLDLSDYALKTDVPTKTSELQNDSGFVTQEHNHNANDIEGLDSAINEALNGASGGTLHVHSNLTTLEGISEDDINNWNNKSDFSGNYNELTNKPTIPTVPKHVSAFINDAGYISELPDMSGYATKDELHNHDNKVTLDKITEEKMTSWDNKSDFSGNYNDLSNKPITPTKTSQLINDSGFVTSDNIQNIDLDNYATKAELPTKLSQLENDSGYLKDGDIHTHENKAVLDTIDATKVNKWDNPDYNDLVNKPIIPDKVSQLTNDLEFVTREYMQNYVPDLSGIDLSALVGTKFDDAVINEEKTTENQTAVDFYANGVIVKTLYLPAGGAGMTDDEREQLVKKFDDVTAGTVRDEENNELTRLTFYSNGTEVKTVQFAGGGGGSSAQGGTLSTTLPEYNTINEGDKVNIPYTFTSPNYGEARLYITIVNGEASRELEYPIIRQGGGNVSLGTLNRGVNYITMYAVDALAKMTNIVNITIVCGALDINSTFDDGQDYSIYSNISIPINVNALDPNDTMMLHYNIDGNQATMQVYNGFNTFVFPADYKTVGVHIVTLQVIGTGFQSNILEYNIVVCDNTHILLSTKSLEVSIEEGYNVELEYRVSTTNVADYSVVYTLDSIEYLRSKAIVGKNKFIGNFKDFPLGDHVLGIVVSSSDGLLTSSLNITIHVVPNSFKRIEHATIGLEAYFDMSRNNNNSLTKNELLSVVPTSAGSTAKLVLHDYNYATNGWIDGRLVSNGKAWAEMVDYLPLEDDAINGFTFDILFRSDNMGNNYANVIECTGVDSPYMGFAIDSEKAILTTEVNKLNTYYTDKEDMRITFIVNRTSTYYEEYIKDPETGWSIKNPNPTYKPNPMIQTFVNGIFTDVAMLSDTGSGNNKIYEHIQNTSKLLINTDKNKTAFGNSSIKSIRIYSRPLDHEEVLQNYMADIDDLMEQKAVYDKNYVTVDQDLPTLNFYDTEIGKCDLMTKDTKQWINVVYTSPNPKLFGESFNLMGQTSWQGTSSLAYPTKNYKFKLYDWARDGNGDIIEASKWDKSTYTKKKINMYPSEPNGKKENTYCLKADYMDSSHCRNTGTARLVNDFLFDGHPNPAKQVDPQTRDTINGFPCNLYINGRWMGVFNFNHDKSCTKTLGMETIPNTVRWEIKANSDSSAGAFIKTWTDKESCYDAINTDFEIVYDEDAFVDQTGSYDVTKYYDELGFAHEGTVMGTYYDYAILSLARFVNFVSGADEVTWKAHISEYCDVEQACRYYLNVMTMGMIDNFAKLLAC